MALSFILSVFFIRPFYLMMCLGNNLSLAVLRIKQTSGSYSPFPPCIMNILVFWTMPRAKPGRDGRMGAHISEEAGLARSL